MRGSPKGRAIAFPRLMPYGGEYPTQKGWGRGTLHRHPGGCSSAPSPEPQTPDSPRMTLVHFPFSPLEPRVSGCEQTFVCWPFKRVPGSLANFHFSLADRNLAAVHNLFLTLVLWAGEPGLATLLRGNPLQLSYLFSTSAANHGSGASPFHIFALPTRLKVASSINPWL